MNLIASATLLLQLAASLLATVQASPNVPQSAREAATEFANHAIQTALNVIEEEKRTLASSTDPTASSTATSTAPVQTEPPSTPTPQQINIPTDKMPQLQNLGSAEVQPAAPAYSLQILSASVPRTGGPVSFRILRDGAPALSQNPAQKDKYATFDQATFEGSYQTFKNTNACKKGYSDTDTFTLTFRGVENDPTVSVSDDQLTLAIQICGEVVTAKVSLSS